MNAANLDRRVTIERPVFAQDPTYGSAEPTWSAVCSCDAEVTDVTPSRAEATTRELSVARNRTRVRIRWRSDIDSSMRVTVHGGGDKLYQIIGGPAEYGGRMQFLELMCERYSS